MEMNYLSLIMPEYYFQLNEVIQTQIMKVSSDHNYGKKMV